jgi:hypothetical protein
LRNPGHVARAWGDTSGGNLRTATHYLGVEWVYPVGRDATSHAGIAIECSVGQHTFTSRDDFAAMGLTSRYHSALIMGVDWQFDGIQFEARFFLVDADSLAARVEVRNTTVDARSTSLTLRPDTTDAATTPSHSFAHDGSLAVSLAPGERRRVRALLTRGSARSLSDLDVTLARLEQQDARFNATRPTLAGDWPAHWPEGLHHDFETTRMLVQDPGGIFTDVWPSWMVAWPRVVLAEGTLDMLRLAYADAELAKRAVLSLFRDAPVPNVPCVFQGGEFNMVAADGSRCGTSPAWCLPFLNLELLYLRTLDRPWLAGLYPGLTRYLEWWLEHRTDADGWLVYKCTWESGEDGNPRLDPTGSGDADISHLVRPIELQATFAHAANVMSFFASELGEPAERWRTLEADYRDRARRLFDPDQGRFRDQLIASTAFVEPCPETPYWDVDACRESPQSLTPLLIGLAIDRSEVERHTRPPWSLWPSWTWSIVESAAAAGYVDIVGSLAFQTIDRVYRVTTRRDLGTLQRPMPGCAPEFWPEDWRTYGGSDAYGWGATTANLLIRHLFGFRESRRTDACAFDLLPALPSALMRRGARYGIRNLSYRGRLFDAWYTVESESTLRAEVGSQLLAVARGERLEVTLP